MKKFLYLLTSLRDAAKDGVIVAGGDKYYHSELLLVIEAVDVESAARALNTKVVRVFDRSSSRLPDIYYTSVGDIDDSEEKTRAGYFFLSLKEPEPSDWSTYPDMRRKMRFLIRAKA